MSEQLELFDAPQDPRVVHCKRAPAGSFAYIGRPSVLGNPFELNDPRDPAARAEVIERYRAYFTERIERDSEFRAAAEALRGQDLGCWCAPRPCHGDVILAWLASNPAAPEN